MDVCLAELQHDFQARSDDLRAVGISPHLLTMGGGEIDLAELPPLWSAGPSEIYATRVWRSWQRARVVYDVHSGLAGELANSFPTGRLPEDIIEYLPHPDPCLIWTHSPTVRCPSGRYGLLRAVFVHGLTARDVLCSTHDPARRYLRLLCVIDVLNDDGGGDAKDMAGYPFYHDLPSTAAAIDEIVAMMPASPGFLTYSQLDIQAPDVRREAVADIFGHTLPILLYAASARADITTPPARPVKKGKSGAARSKPNLQRIGYRIGPALDRARRLPATTVKNPAGAGTGRTVRPHPRRGHWQIFKVGAGRTQARLLWLHPLIVHAEALGVATVIRTGPRRAPKP